MTIRNPVEWGWDHLKQTNRALGAAGRNARRAGEHLHSPAPAIRQIGTADLWDSLARGLEDFGAFRTDVIFLCVAYPIIGLVLARVVFGDGMLPLLFPLVSGFALIGPLAAVGLYEMSRRREQGLPASWADAFGVVQAPSFGAIFMLGLVLVAIFLLWLVAAEMIYGLTLGPEAPASLGDFVSDVFTTGAGWAMIGIGIGIGFLFAALVFGISVISFPLLLDREAGLDTAVWASLRAVAASPGPMALWGLIIACGLVLGSIPFLLGLAVVLPILGHASWHLYRRVVP